MPPKRRQGARGGALGAKRSAGFEEFYAGVYGTRWPALRKALTAASPKKVLLWNRFCQLPFAKVMANMKRMDEESLLQVFRCQDGCEVAPPASDAFNVKAYYPLDYASALVVEQLEVGAFDRVLDVCAAFGGNSIGIAQFLSADGALTVNEPNHERSARLRRNIREYIPSNYVPVTITQRNAETWYAPSMYHRVLVDAPCSAERYFLQRDGGAPVSPKMWTEQTSLELSRRGCVLLLRALETCRPGGRVVYSTRSLSPLENDGVVEDALRRTRCQVEVHPTTLCNMGEKTRYGHIVLPDTAGGFGPLFCCVIHKVSDRREEVDSNEEGEECEYDDENGDS
ncbi:hypothetical protein C3747_12g298 [Trypanosoma cruzi]|uniref:NOL1/NOP2/Sun domain family member 4 n=2 Tax=Trypanosoma cruzi TaxID=5693 RepID=Q4DNN4_TRYCC|nr:hypothetical protein, conserved [Trypanosoma cruzi]EAN94133.1 hypothetical protein, conserved [Trypanosoma cruzi]PWV18866.1 hypothetical protein C3747_12g298 [Trypanosoma cruzi]RNC41467.1 hypothetical protein TcCL_NonESM08954 [Trypanosoma cruzi]|eukprot:XP_815984.1 hypothetical protein [Trypanosoma cruzi strain CL Brener]